MIHRISFDTKNNLFFLNFINTKTFFSAPGFIISFYLVIENSCFCSLFLFSVNAVRAVITSRTISESRYYKDEKRGFWDEKKFYISLNVYIFTFYLNFKYFLAKKICPQFPFKLSDWWNFLICSTKSFCFVVRRKSFVVGISELPNTEYSICSWFWFLYPRKYINK